MYWTILTCNSKFLDWNSEIWLKQEEWVFPGSPSSTAFLNPWLLTFLVARTLLHYQGWWVSDSAWNTAWFQLIVRSISSAKASLVPVWEWLAYGFSNVDYLASPTLVYLFTLLSCSTFLTAVFPPSTSPSSHPHPFSISLQERADLPGITV